MSNAYGCDGMTSAMAERFMGLDRELTTAEANEIERRLEEKAEDEISAGADAYTEWLANDGLEHALSIAKAASCWPRMAHWAFYNHIDEHAEREDLRQQNIDDALARARRDYIAYRVNTFTDDERAEVEREVIGEVEA